MGSTDESVENGNDSGLKTEQKPKVDCMSKHGNRCM